MMKTARVYTRTSGETGKSNKGFGMETQRQSIKEYCRENDIEIVEWYESDGVSGVQLEKDTRLMDLLADINGEDYIISYSTCRLLGRDPYRQIMVKRQLTKSNKKVIFTNQLDYDLYETDPTNVLINSMMGILDVYEKMNVSLRLAKSRRNKVRKTKQKGSGKAPLGYRWETINGERVIVINEEMKKVVEFLYKTYNPRNRFTTLRGLETKVMEEYGIKLSPAGIRSILTNEFYVGTITHGEGVTIKGNHDTFISKVRFNKVGKLLKNHRNSSSK